MTEQPTDNHGDPATTTDSIRSEIEQTRSELSDTVDQLADKLNVKAHARDSATAAKDAVAAKASQAKAATPESVQRALDTAGAKLGPAAHEVAVKTKPHRGKIFAGAGVTVVGLLIVRKARARKDAS